MDKQIENQNTIKKESVEIKKTWDKKFKKIYIYTFLIVLAFSSVFLVLNYFYHLFIKDYSFSFFDSLTIFEYVTFVPFIFFIIAIPLKLFKKLHKPSIFLLFFFVVLGFICIIFLQISTTTIDKPVIYLYPNQKQNTFVQLNFQGKIIADYPEYDDAIKGWEVTAYPDGKIINHADNKEYSYIFWEGQPKEKINWDLSSGFIIEGKNTKAFLQKTLSEIGLTPKEYNEFIVYWYPKMKDNPYNLIHFASEKYTDSAPLKITPQPDSMLRVFMVFKPLDKKIKIAPQEIKKFERKGFAVIEWGGTELK